MRNTRSLAREHSPLTMCRSRARRWLRWDIKLFVKERQSHETSALACCRIRASLRQVRWRAGRRRLLDRFPHAPAWRFVLRGACERLDGHDYVEKALQAGASGAVVAIDQAERFAASGKVLIVKDTLVALQRLGAAVRRLWGKRLVGVTGSAGKTTTKDVIAHVLSTRFRVLKSQGNLNNHFGLPLQLLKLEAEHDIAVIEMGMSHAGEITALCEIAKPDWGVVTSVAPVHLEFFPDGIAGIARAKYELIASLPPSGVAFLNADDPYVSQFGRDFRGKVVMFGISHAADVSAKSLEDLGPRGSRFQLHAGGVITPAELPLLGSHNVSNALAGVAVALEAGVTPSQAAASLASLKAPEKRGQVLQINGATLI